MKFLTRIFGTRNDKLIKQLQPLVDKINSLEKSLISLDDEGLKVKTSEFKERINKGEQLDNVLPEAFAVCREGAKRVLGQRHFDVQLMGGVVLHQGKIAEMKTGEGKTLTATLAAYLNALSGKGSHVVTVNDYLAKRDAEWMGVLYNFLGLSTGNIVHGLSDEERKQAYASDITYGTNNEFGFDFLRDNMKVSIDSLVQRGHNFAIVDEVDSILIDEARTPLIISGASDTDVSLYTKINAVVPGIQKDIDYVVDEKSNTVSLTEDGINKMERRLSIKNLYSPEHIQYLHHVQIAVKAHILFKKDVDYVVRNDEILIVDEFTGRLMPGRRYSDGLHGALEAKEHVSVQQESQTMASITFQNYFRMYNNLSGMTGTADTEAVEFNKIYNLDVVVIPTNKQIIRDDQEDVIYLSAKEKFHAIADEVQKAQEAMQPVLVGTVSVEKSELLSHLLEQRNVSHEILNAKNHAREASIIASAGEKAHVTIATNMAGRGTDIVLGDGVIDCGGLYVIGTERHESRRIDNQLRGRSGRQGDPGKTKFFLSLEDDLMRIFASDRMSAIMTRFGMKSGEAIVSPMVTKAIERAQKRVEEQNFSSRKNLLEYDDVMSQQRQVVYERRKNALLNKDIIDFKEDMIFDIVSEVVTKFSPFDRDTIEWEFDLVAKEVKNIFAYTVDLSGLDNKKASVDDLINTIKKQLVESYAKKVSVFDQQQVKKLENYVYLQIIDNKWKDHLLAMDHLKDSVSLRGYGQKDPLQEYKKEAFILFSGLIVDLERDVVSTLLRMEAPQKIEEDDFSQDEQEDLQELNYDHPQAANTTQQQQAKEEIAQGPGSSHKVQTFQREGKKIGRNDPCPCGSGKKYKKCHGDINKNL
jgi:preprotein translocase subunit SecA